MKKIHYYSGIFISLFIALHFTNHLFALVSPEKHIAVMESFRLIYRNVFAEILLVAACLLQTFAGIQLFLNKRKHLRNGYDKLQVYSGLYLVVFLIFHPLAIFAGRYYFNLDTNFWYAAAVVNIVPLLFFYIPYYFFGVFAFFTHIACIHRLKAKALGWKNTDRQAQIIMGIGAIIGLLILAGLTDNFQFMEIPLEYREIYE